MKELIKKVLKTDNMKEIEKFNDGFGKTTVYGIETDNHILKVWNSSNHSSFNHGEALKRIAEYLIDDETAGNFDDGWMHEIMFEVIEK
jgi:hypothetical protein